MLKKLILIVTVAVLSLSAYLLYQDRHKKSVAALAAQDQTVFSETIAQVTPGLEIK